MNKYTKMLLIPEDEYNKLKSIGTDKITRALKNNLPPQLRQNVVNKAISESLEPSQTTPTPTRDSFASFETPKMEWDEEGEAPILKKLNDLLTPKGKRIVNTAQKPIPASNINQVMDYLSTSTPIQRGPPGYKKVIRQLVNQDYNTDFIRQPRAAIYAEDLERAHRLLDIGEASFIEHEKRMKSLHEPQHSSSQSGQGWSSIKNF